MRSVSFQENQKVGGATAYPRQSVTDRENHNASQVHDNTLQTLRETGDETQASLQLVTSLQNHLTIFHHIHSQTDTNAVYRDSAHEKKKRLVQSNAIFLHASDHRRTHARNLKMDGVDNSDDLTKKQAGRVTPKVHCESRAKETSGCVVIAKLLLTCLAP